MAGPRGNEEPARAFSTFQRFSVRPRGTAGCSSARRPARPRSTPGGGSSLRQLPARLCARHIDPGTSGPPCPHRHLSSVQRPAPLPSAAPMVRRTRKGASFRVRAAWPRDRRAGARPSRTASLPDAPARRQPSGPGWRPDDPPRPGPRGPRPAPPRRPKLRHLAFAADPGPARARAPAPRLLDRVRGRSAPGTTARAPRRRTSAGSGASSSSTASATPPSWARAEVTALPHRPRRRAARQRLHPEPGLQRAALPLPRSPRTASSPGSTTSSAPSGPCASRSS